MNILIVTASYIEKEGNFNQEIYWYDKNSDKDNKENDQGYVIGWFTNEAPARYLVKKLLDEAHDSFDKVYILATKECNENLLNFDVQAKQPCGEIDDELLQKDLEITKDIFSNNKGLTTKTYFEKKLLAYMREISPDRYDSKKEEDLFSIIEVSDDIKKEIQNLVDELKKVTDNPWESNIYMDTTGGSRKVSLAGIMLLRCMDLAGFNVRSVVYSNHQTGSPNRIEDVLPVYGMFDSVIASEKLNDPKFNGNKAEAVQTLKDAGIDENLIKYGVYEKRDFYEPYKYESDQENRAEDSPKPYIFLSYAHKDMIFAQSFLYHMDQLGYRIWYDEGITPSTKWQESIEDHISHCYYFVALVSEGFVQSEYCKQEWEQAEREEKKRLMIYIDVDPGKLPDYLPSDNEQGIEEKKYKKADFYKKVRETKDINECCI